MAEPVGGTLSREFRRLYEDAGLTQPQVAEHLGIPQSTVSEWARGTSLPRVTAFPMLERLCRVPIGTILRRAGYVEDSATDVITAIANASDLDETGKRLVSMLYSEVRRPARPTITLQSEPNEDTKSASSSILP